MEQHVADELMRAVETLTGYCLSNKHARNVCNSTCIFRDGINNKCTLPEMVTDPEYGRHKLYSRLVEINEAGLCSTDGLAGITPEVPITFADLVKRRPRKRW